MAVEQISMAVEPISVAVEFVSMPLGTHAFNKVSDLVTMVGVSLLIPGKNAPKTWQNGMIQSPSKKYSIGMQTPTSLLPLACSPSPINPQPSLLATGNPIQSFHFITTVYTSFYFLFAVSSVLSNLRER
jgi:hypothetical protein